MSTPIWAAAGGVLAALALFIWRELVAPEPFLHLGGFAFRTVALTMLASAFWCAALYGVAIQLPDCLLVLGYEHWKTGWVILPDGADRARGDVPGRLRPAARRPGVALSGSAWPA